jgi:hypothetical protein
MAGWCKYTGIIKGRTQFALFVFGTGYPSPTWFVFFIERAGIETRPAVLLLQIENPPEGG